MLQLVFRLLNDSVAAMKMEISCFWPLGLLWRDWGIASTPEVVEGIAFASWLDVLSAGPLSFAGEGGGVG